MTAPVASQEIGANGTAITCSACDGKGVVAGWTGVFETPEECGDCCGSGRNWRYNGGAIARYYAGPLIGRDVAQ